MNSQADFLGRKTDSVRNYTNYLESQTNGFYSQE